MEDSHLMIGDKQNKNNIKKTKMKKLKIMILAMLLAGLSVSAQDTSIELGLFDELKAYDQLNITLVRSAENKAVISGENKDDVKIANEEGRLKIRLEVEDLLDGNKTFVTLYHTEDLNLVDANEGASIMSENKLSSKILSLKAQEGSKILVSVNTRNLDIKSVTGSKIEVSGTTAEQNVTVRTGGEYHGIEVKSVETDVTVFAGGKAYVRASDMVNAHVTAGGLIEIFGKPAKVDKDETFGGKIKMAKL